MIMEKLIDVDDLLRRVEELERALGAKNERPEVLPVYPVTTEFRCHKCGFSMSESMHYVCPVFDCPGRARVTC
jgi:rubrerythrin